MRNTPGAKHLSLVSFPPAWSRASGSFPRAHRRGCLSSAHQIWCFAVYDEARALCAYGRSSFEGAATHPATCICSMDSNFRKVHPPLEFLLTVVLQCETFNLSDSNIQPKLLPWQIEVASDLTKLEVGNEDSLAAMEVPHRSKLCARKP